MTDTVPAFTAAQLRALAVALDGIIPPRPDGLPGAGGVGVAAYVDAALVSLPELHAMVARSLDALDELARAHGVASVADLPPAEQTALVNALACSDDALPPIVMLHAFAGYYQQARVVEALGMPARPPHPQGYEMEPVDLTLLEPVRRRGACYRDC
ncbi:MAG: gluconate 2-dehydrogenase subunit 3 family protein [bacterium]